MNRKTVCLQLRLSQQLKDKLTKYCEEHETTYSQVLRDYILELTKEEEENGVKSSME